MVGLLAPSNSSPSLLPHSKCQSWMYGCPWSWNLSMSNQGYLRDMYGHMGTRSKSVMDMPKLV